MILSLVKRINPFSSEKNPSKYSPKSDKNELFEKFKLFAFNIIPIKGETDKKELSLCHKL